MASRRNSGSSSIDRFLATPSSVCYAGGDFGGLVDQLELSPMPCRAELHGLWWLAAVVAHLRRQRFIFPIEARRQRRTVDAEAFLRGINSHGRIHTQNIIQT